jgi:pyrroline-5-carboxylate reductase
MACAMIRTWLSSGITTADRICISDVPAVHKHVSKLGVSACYPEADAGGAAQLAEDSEVILLCVKPQVRDSMGFAWTRIV